MGQRLGSLIGAIGGVLFVLINAGVLPWPLSLVVRLVGVLIFLAVVWYAVLRRRPAPPEPAVPARALRVYWICVAAEVIAIPLGSQLLVRVLHQPALTPVWVVFVVGVHFVPFARAFRVPLFALLAAWLIAVAVIGAAVTLGVGPAGAGWTGIVAGLLLLAFAYAGARRRPPAGQGAPEG